MKKILLILILLGLLVFPLAGVAQQRVPDVDVLDVLENLVDWLFTILLIVAAIAIVIAGYYFVTAAGDPEVVKKARMFVIYALVGVAVALLSRGMIMLVQRIIY